MQKQFTSINKRRETIYLPRLGKIRLGLPVTGKGTKSSNIGESEVDYFVCPPEVRKVYGDKPKELDIMIPTNDINIWFPIAYEHWKGDARWCRGNGIEAERQEGNHTIMVPCRDKEPCKHITKGSQKLCMPVGRLSVILYKIDMGGIYQIDTRSVTAQDDAWSADRYLTKLFSERGTYAMMPLKLRRVPRTFKVPNPKNPDKQMSVTKAIMEIRYHGTLDDKARFEQQEQPLVISTDIVCQESNEPPDCIEENETSSEQLTKLAKLAKKLGLDKKAYVEILAEAGFTTPKDMTTEIYDKVNRKFDDYKPNTLGKEGADKTAEQKELESFSEGEDLNQPLEQETKTKAQEGAGGAVDFFKFMPKARAEIIELTGDSKLYDTELESFSVRFLSELKGNTKKQADIRKRFESLLVETRKLNGVPEPV